jgi:hypothetical protein
LAQLDCPAFDFAGEYSIHITDNLACRLLTSIAALGSMDFFVELFFNSGERRLMAAVFFKSAQ